MDLIKQALFAATSVSALAAALFGVPSAFGYNGGIMSNTVYSSAPSPNDVASEEYVDEGGARQVGYAEYQGGYTQQTQPVVYASQSDAYAAQQQYASQYAGAYTGNQYAAYADEPVVLEKDLSIDEKFEQLKAEFDALSAKVDKKTDKPDSKNKFTSKWSGLFAFGSMCVSQNDASKAAVGDVQNSSLLRDARLTYKAEGYDVLFAEMGISFCNDFYFRNVIVGVKKVPFFQEVKVGYFKAETDMNLQDAVIDTPAMYYNTNTMADAVWRRIGAASTMMTEDKHIRWFNAIQTGKGWGNTASLQDDEPGLIMTSRLTATPVVREDADGNLLELLHVGGSFMYVDPAGSADHKVTLRQRPTGWANSMPYILSAAYPMGSKGYSIAEGEVAWQVGSFGIQSETLVGSFDRFGSNWGQELFIRWMLDPESYHTYAYDRGCFGNVKLKHNLGKDKDSQSAWLDHYGVFEPFVMLTYSDMDSMKNVPGGVYGDYFETIVGVNWWMCPQIKWAINYEHGVCDSTKVDTGENFDGKMDTIGLQVNAAF